MMEFSGYTVQFTFDKHETGHTIGRISDKKLEYRGAVVVTVYYNGVPAFFGKSHCSTSDKFNRVTGAREALRNIAPSLIGEDAKEIWQAFVEYIPTIKRVDVQIDSAKMLEMLDYVWLLRNLR